MEPYLIQPRLPPCSTGDQSSQGQDTTKAFLQICLASQKLVTRFLRDPAPSWMTSLRTRAAISTPAERVTQG